MEKEKRIEKQSAEVGSKVDEFTIDVLEGIRDLFKMSGSIDARLESVEALDLSIVDPERTLRDIYVAELDKVINLLRLL